MQHAQNNAHESAIAQYYNLGVCIFRARVDTQVATQTVQHGKTAQKDRFGILPSGGTPRDEAAFSHGVARSVIAVGTK